MVSKPIDPDRRTGADRRRIDPLLADWRWILRGRRRRPRRTGDPHGGDRYDPRLVAIAAAILLLSGLDATLTLILVQSGVVREANPFMRIFLDHDVQVFVNLKTALTASGLLLLVAASHSRLLPRFPVRRIIHALLVLYVALIGYELLLLRMVEHHVGAAAGMP